MSHYDAAANVLRMTMPEWKRLHRDFKGALKGQDGKRIRTALYCVPGRGTSLVPVEIVKESS